MYGKKERTKRLVFDLVLEVIGLVLIFCVLLFVQTRFSVSQQKENSSDKLDIAIQRLEANEEEAADRLGKYDDFSQAKVDTIAYYYDNNADDVSSIDEMANQWSLTDLYILDKDKNMLQENSGASPDFKTDDAFAPLWEDSTPVSIDMTRFYAAPMENGNLVVAGRDITDFMATEDELTSLAYSMHSIKVGSKGYITVINVADNTIAYHPEADLIGKDLTEAHLDNKMMQDGYAGWATCAGEEFYSESRLATIEGTDYQFIALRPRAMMQNTIMKMVYLITFVFAVILTIIVLYFHFIRVEQDKRFLDGDEEMEYVHLGGKLYLNQTIFAKAGPVLIIGLIVIFLSAYYLQTLSVLSTRSARSAEKMEDISDIFDENQDELQRLKDEYVAEYEGRTRNIAYLIGKDPTLVDNDKLIELSNRAQIKYIYVFDEEGKVTSSNGIFTEFALSHDTTDPTYEYWNVIKGSKDIIIKDVEEDTYEAGHYVQYIGTTRIDAPGMIQLGISPRRLNSRIEAVQTPFTLSNIAVENDGFTMAVNKEDSTLTYYPDEAYIGNEAKSVGLDKSALSDSFAGYQTIDGAKCFVTSMEYGDEYIYVAVPVSSITSGRLILAAIATLTSFVILLIIFALTLIGQPKKILHQKPVESKDVPLKEPDGTIEIMTGSGKVRRVESVLSRWNLNTLKWSDCTAEQKLKKVIFGLCALISIFLVFYMYSQRGTYDKNSILSYIINSNFPPEIRA